MDVLNSGCIDGVLILIEFVMKLKQKGLNIKVVVLGYYEGNVIMG